MLKRLDDRQKLLTLSLHALFICIIFIIPEALLRAAIPNRTLEITWPMYAKSIITLGVFYLNYFIVIPRTLHRDSNRRWEFLAWNVVIVVAATFLIWLFYNMVYNGPRPYRADMSPQQSHLAWASYIIRDAVMLILAIALAVALRISRRWLYLEQRNKDLLAMRKQSELDSLRSQLNPHFLFNTLNAIYALIAVCPADAQKAVHQLSNLLRYVVYDNPKRVPLAQEIDFVKNYVELMRLRMPNRPISLEVSGLDKGAVQIAPLLFVSIIENAFKHGNTADTSLPISISITSDGNLVECITTNYTDKKPSSAPSGVGLANVKRRLELLYGESATLCSSLSADSVYTSQISIITSGYNPLP